jgi:uncharacterized protein (TIGR03435 family)
MRGLKRAALFIPYIASLSIAVFPSLVEAQKASAAIFDVSSVKTSPPGTSQGSIRRLDIGTVSITGMTIRDLIGLFFHVRPYQISGGPAWVAKERFDIVGKDSTISGGEPKKLDPAAWSAAMEANDEKMRGLLADRFALKFHHENRVMPVFLLVPDKGANFVAVPCSASYRLQHGWVDGDIRMASLAALLKAEMEAPVQDKTGLPNCYHLEGRWTTDPDNTSLPQVPTVLHDLGLRLQRANGDVDILVIDHLDLPQPD